jgi:hypothetical protein
MEEQMISLGEYFRRNLAENQEITEREYGIKLGNITIENIVNWHDREIRNIVPPESHHLIPQLPPTLRIKSIAYNIMNAMVKTGKDTIYYNPLFFATSERSANQTLLHELQHLVLIRAREGKGVPHYHAGKNEEAFAEAMAMRLMIRKGREPVFSLYSIINGREIVKAAREMAELNPTEAIEYGLR